MRLAVLLMAMAVAGAAPAAAVPGVLDGAADAKACFERSYDAAHLARNPAQVVTRIRIAVSREVFPGSVGVPPQEFLRIELARRGDTQIRRAIGSCGHPFGGTKVDGRGREIKSKADGARCLLTGEDHMNAEEGNDGGSIDIRPEQGGLLARLSSPLRLRTGSQVSIDKGREMRLGAADRVFRLTKLPAAACDDLRKAIREE